MDATIIIPTFERKDVLLRTLEAISEQNYDGPWEVVVVDDGSRDGTSEAVTGWIAGRDRFRYVRQENSGPARARNRGAAEASGRVLVFIDNDILVEKDFLARHLRALNSHPGTWIVGRIVSLPELKKTAFGRFRIAMTEEFQGSQNERELESMTAANLSLPAADFRSLGGFDEQFEIASCEDADLALRARAAGIRLRYMPDIVGTHLDWADTLERFCERQRLYSISDVVLFRKHGEASPRAALVRDNAPAPYRAAGTGGLRRGVRSFLSRDRPRRILGSLTTIADRSMPDTAALHALYRLAIGAAIYRGVQEGFAQKAKPKS